MATQLQTYTAYKDSGIEWLGQIPSHWSISHNKRISNNITDGAHTSPDLSSNDYPFLSVVNLKNNQLDFINCHYTSESDYKYLRRNGCQPKINDILFSKDGTIGESIVIKDNREFVVGSSFIIISPNLKIITSKYFQYYLSSSFIKSIARVFVKGTGIPRLSIFNFSRLSSLVPPKKEQIQIAAYLDQKTATIDKKITLLQKKITHYTHYRKSLINEVVTGKRLVKGNATIPIAESDTKDSGISWIGKIPKHWINKRVKDLADKNKYYPIGDGDHGSIKPSMYQNYGIPYIRVQNLNWNGEIDTSKIVYISKDIQNKNKKSKLFKDDILIAKTGATVGKLGLISEPIKEANTTSSVGKVTVDRKKYLPKFILYVFMSDYFQKRLKLIASQKSAQPGFNIDDLILFEISTPNSLEEQQQIATFLDEKTETIDAIIANLQAQITTLQELRKTLINDVVTGKVSILHTEAAQTANTNTETS